LPTLSTRKLIQFCAKTLLYRDPLEAANLTFLSVVEDANVRQPIEEAVKLVFGKRVVMGRLSQAGDAIGRTRKTPRASRSSPGVGRVASEVTDPTEMEAIWVAYKKNGGTLSFQQIERSPRVQPARRQRQHGIPHHQACRGNEEKRGGQVMCSAPVGKHSQVTLYDPI
jgi:hypothetical protein